MIQERSQSKSTIQPLIFRPMPIAPPFGGTWSIIQSFNPHPAIHCQAQQNSGTGHVILQSQVTANPQVAIKVQGDCYAGWARQMNLHAGTVIRAQVAVGELVEQNLCGCEFLAVLYLAPTQKGHQGAVTVRHLTAQSSVGLSLSVPEDGLFELRVLFGIWGEYLTFFGAYCELNATYEAVTLDLRGVRLPVEPPPDSEPNAVELPDLRLPETFFTTLADRGDNKVMKHEIGSDLEAVADGLRTFKT